MMQPMVSIMRPSLFNQMWCTINQRSGRWTLTSSINWKLRTKREWEKLKSGTSTRKKVSKHIKKLWQRWRNTGRLRSNSRTLPWAIRATVVVWNQTSTWTLLWSKNQCPETAKRNFLKKTVMQEVRDLLRRAAKLSKGEEFSRRDAKNSRLNLSVTWVTSIFRILSRAYPRKRNNFLSLLSSMYLQKLKGLKMQKSF